MNPGPRSLAAVGLALVILARPVGAASPPAPGPLTLPQGDAGAVELLQPAGESPPAAPAGSPPAARHSYRRAWIALGAGAAFTGLSFLLAERADDAYARYEADLTPPALDADYAEAVRYDRLATASLLVGQLSFALGLYWRLVHRAPKAPAAETGAAPDPSHPTLAASTPAPLVCTVGRGGLRLGVALAF